MSDLFNQMVNITKAQDYNIINDHRKVLIEENKALKAEVSRLKNLVAEYTHKMQENLKPKP
jgi:regulator of replication initiation timing